MRLAALVLLGYVAAAYFSGEGVEPPPEKVTPSAPTVAASPDDCHCLIPANHGLYR